MKISLVLAPATNDATISPQPLCFTLSSRTIEEYGWFFDFKHKCKRRQQQCHLMVQPTYDMNAYSQFIFVNNRVKQFIIIKRVISFIVLCFTKILPQLILFGGTINSHLLFQLDCESFVLSNEDHIILNPTIRKILIIYSVEVLSHCLI